MRSPLGPARPRDSSFWYCTHFDFLSTLSYFYRRRNGLQDETS
jgi:hypothetical protein